MNIISATTDTSGMTKEQVDMFLEGKFMLQNGVNDVIWSEIVQVVGRKRSIPSRIIDML